MLGTSGVAILSDLAGFIEGSLLKKIPSSNKLLQLVPGLAIFSYFYWTITHLFTFTLYHTFCKSAFYLLALIFVLGF